MQEVNKDNFAEEVLNAEKPVMVDFWSDGCDHCQELMPEVEKLAEKYGEQMKFTKLNIKGNRRFAISQQVMGLPSIVYYNGGEKVAHLSNEDLTADEIEEMIKEIISS